MKNLIFVLNLRWSLDTTWRVLACSMCVYCRICMEVLWVTSRNLTTCRKTQLLYIPFKRRYKLGYIAYEDIWQWDTRAFLGSALYCNLLNHSMSVPYSVYHWNSYSRYSNLPTPHNFQKPSSSNNHSNIQANLKIKIQKQFHIMLYFPK